MLRPTDKLPRTPPKGDELLSFLPPRFDSTSLLKGNCTYCKVLEAIPVPNLYYSFDTGSYNFALMDRKAML